MKYIKTVGDTTIIKPANEIIIYKNNKQIINPTHKMLLEDGWQEHIITPIEPSEEELLEQLKILKIQELEAYDQSDEINCFYVNNIPIWLDKVTRSGLLLRFNAEMEMGKKQTSLWYDDMEFPLVLTTAVYLLYALEVYASECYDNTKRHRSIINKCDNYQTLLNYDFKTGYPEKLRF